MRAIVPAFQDYQDSPKPCPKGTPVFTSGVSIDLSPPTQKFTLLNQEHYAIGKPPSASISPSCIPVYPPRNISYLTSLQPGLIECDPVDVGALAAVLCKCVM